MPNRMLKEGIKRSEQIDQLSWFEEVVFYRLLVTADDYGCVDGRSVLLRNDLFPTKDNITKKAIEDAIDRLTSVDLLRKYEVSGKPYLFFPTWEKHQRLRAKTRKYPEPPAEIVEKSSVNTITDTCLTHDGQVTDIGLLEEEVEEEVETLSNESVARAHARNKKFTPPTVEEVGAYCRGRNNLVNPNRFVNYYTANGWKVGKAPMKDWKAAVRTWEGNGYAANGKNADHVQAADDQSVDPMLLRAAERRRQRKGAEI